MSIRQLPSGRWTVPGNSGVIANGYYVYTYQPGTSTPKATYNSYTGETANSNPIVLNARGEANIWWDGTYAVYVYTGDKDAGGVLVWNQDNYGEGTSSVLQGNFNLALNGSFEQDTNGDGDPDNWTITRYTGGTVALDTTDQIHGAKSLKFTSIGTGGGYATSDLFEVEGSKTVPVSFAILASIATVHNQVDIVWYTAAAAVISTSTLYDDTATNPTSWTSYTYSATAPATARYALIRLYGCKDDDAQAGSTWFDNVVVDAAAAGLFPNVNAQVNASDEEIDILDGALLSTADINILNGANSAGATGVTATPTINKIPIADQTGGRLAWGWKPSFRGAIVYNSSAQSISDSTYTAMLCGSEYVDTDSLHSTSTNTSRVGVPNTGASPILVALSATVDFAVNATGTRQVEIRLNGSVVVSGVQVPGNAGLAGAGCSISVACAAYPVTVSTQYFEVYVSQNSGGALNATITNFSLNVLE